MLEKGQEFTYLTVDEYVMKTKVKCLCKCGKEKWTTERSLLTGHIKSCGCYNQELRKARTGKNNGRYKDGLINHPLYDSWQSTKTRCYNKNYSGYLNGIEMDPSWKNDFIIFYNWATSNGWKKGLVLSRIDNNGDFRPANCCFKTKGDIVKNNYNYEQAKKTSLEKYGVEHVGKTNKFWQKVRATCLEKYGTKFPQTLDSIKERVKKTNIDRYGVENYSKTNECKNKIKETCQKRYGVDWVVLDPNIQQKQKETSIKNGFTKIYDGRTSKDWSESLGISYSGLNARIRKFGFDQAITMEKGQSAIETIIENLLIKNNIEYKKQFEVENRYADFFLPQNNLIIECDGLYWHSDAVQDDKNYHKNKQNLYLKYGYNSLFFREDEIENQIEIVESIILNKIGKSKKMHARKTKLKELKKPQLFFSHNHLMGKGRGKCLALYVNDEIVAAIQYINKKDYIEISRFCNKLEIIVVGGLSKLLTGIQKLYPDKKIISFVDRRYGSGISLEKMGFIKKTDYISFKWVKDNKTIHRMKFKNNTGYDNGYNKIWDCGQIKYILEM